MKKILLLMAALLITPIPPLAAQSRGSVRPAPRTSDGKPDFTGVYQGGSTKRGDWDFQVPGDQPGVPTAATQSIATSQARRRSCSLPALGPGKGPGNLKPAFDQRSDKPVPSRSQHALPQRFVVSDSVRANSEADRDSL